MSAYDYNNIMVGGDNDDEEDDENNTDAYLAASVELFTGGGGGGGGGGRDGASMIVGAFTVSFGSACKAAVIGVGVGVIKGLLSTNSPSSQSQSGFHSMEINDDSNSSSSSSSR